MGSLRGAVLGGYLLGISTVALQAICRSSCRPSATPSRSLLVIVVLTVRPQGIIVPDARGTG